MVTTRSADKATPVKSTAENLTLRSRPLDSENTPPPSSTKKRSKIIVNVPPPRKRTRLSYDGADETEEPTVTSISDTTRTEIPDSQDSPLKPVVVEKTHAEIEFSLSDKNESTASVQPSAKRQRKANVTPSSTSRKSKSEATPNSSGKHRRFGSEDPVEDLVPEDDTSAQQVHDDGHVQSDDESDAPEVATTKNASATVSSQKRRRIPKKPTNALASDNAILSTPSQGLPSSSEPPTNQAQKPEVTTTPALKLKTDQHHPLDDDQHSQASTDTPFVTARPYRHFDAFETPKTNHTPDAPSQSRQNDLVPFKGSSKDTDTQVQLVNGVSSDFGSLAVSISGHKSGTEVLRSTNLPAKASNSLESYRRQVMRSRVGTKRKFKLQEHWAGRRGKFVVGF